MKKLLLHVVLISGICVYSEKNETVKAVAVTADNIETLSDSYKVRSKEMTIDHDTNIVEYNGEVVFSTDVVTLEADKVIFNRNTKEVTATGEFRFKGVPLQFETGTKPKKLRYKLGDTVAYIE